MKSVESFLRNPRVPLLINKFSLHFIDAKGSQEPATGAYPQRNK